MKKIIPQIAFLVLLLGTSVFGDSVELNLFDLGCPSIYDINNPYWQTDFDLGVTFSKISHVYIDWSGEINARLYREFGDPNLIPSDGSLMACIGSVPGEGWLRSADVWGGESTYPAPEPFDVISEFSLLDPGATWNSFLDGKDIITILRPHVITEPPFIYQGSAVLDDATLIIEGTVIPEPATLFLLAFGTLFLRKHKK